MVDPIVIKGGTVVIGEGRYAADVLVREGVVASVGVVSAPDAQTVSADGCLVLPGGVDAHTHLFGAPESDGIAALCGGTTSAVTFVDQRPGEKPAAAIERGIREQIPKSPIDLAMHGVIWEPAGYRPGDLLALADGGAPSVKLWLAYREDGIMADDDQLFGIMSEAAEAGVLVLAHCENGSLVSAIAERLRAAGRTGLSEHGRARPIALEAEAVHRFLRIAGLTGADTYVVHVSGREPLQEIMRARARGQRVYAEVCTHHLVLDESVYAGEDAIRYMVTPPLRRPADVATLWRELACGDIDVYSSDHSHLRINPDKLVAANDVTAIPFGLPGIQWRLPVAFSEGVDTGRLTVERLVEVACSAPARAFGLYPRKGSLLPGADADVVIWDPQAQSTISERTRCDGVDYSPFDGFELRGLPRTVIADGEIVVHDGEYLGRRQPARFLSRAPLGRRGALPHVSCCHLEPISLCEQP